MKWAGKICTCSHTRKYFLSPMKLWTLCFCMGLGISNHLMGVSCQKGCSGPELLEVRVRRHLALAGVGCQLMDISTGIQCWPTTLSYWSLHVAGAPLFAPCIITANNSSLVSAATRARKETTCANLSRVASIRRRHRPAAAQLAFTSSCCGQVHVKYGILNEECFCHEIGPILADELFTAFWQGMAVVVKP